MVFIDYKRKDAFNNKFVEKIAEITLTHKSTVYRWLNGASVPTKLKQEIIANHLNSTPDKLFPKS